MKNVTHHEREIAKALGISVNGLDVLRRLNRGDNITGNNTGTMLDKKGLTELAGPLASNYSRRLTDAGRDFLRKAREMGF